MSDTKFLGAFRAPFFIWFLVRKIKKIPNCIVHEPIVDYANTFDVTYDFEVDGWRFRIEREYSDCKLYVKGRNAPAEVTERVKAIFVKR